MQEVRRDAPVAWWRFTEENTQDGSAATDVMGSHPGIYHGKVVPGSQGNRAGGCSVRLDGRSYVEVAHHKDFELNELSVEFWFHSSQTWSGARWPFGATFVTKATPGAASGDWTVNGGCAVLRTQARVRLERSDYCRPR